MIRGSSRLQRRVSNSGRPRMASSGRFSWIPAWRAVLVGATATAVACGGGDTSVAPVVTPPPVAVASVVVTPGTSLITVGGSTQLSVEIKSASGTVLTGRSVTWSSSNTGVATVSLAGVVTGVSAGGPVTIMATSEGVNGVASATVTAKPVGSVTVTSPIAQIFIGGNTQLTATVRATDASVLTGRVVIWSSSNSAIATVSQSGLVTGVSVGGPVTLTAAGEGVSGAVSLTVAVAPVSTVIVTAIRPTMIVGVAMPLTV